MAEAIENTNSLMEEYTKKIDDILNKREMKELGLEDLGKVMTSIQEFSNAIENAEGLSDDYGELIKNSMEEVEILNSQRVIAANTRAIEIEANNARIEDHNAAISALKTTISSMENASARFLLEQYISRLEEEIHEFERTNQRLQDEINIALNGGELELPEITDKLTQTQIENMMKYINNVKDKKAPGVAPEALNFEEMLGIDPSTVTRTKASEMSEEEVKESLGESKEHTETSNGTDDSSGEAAETSEKDEIETMDFFATTPDTTDDADSGEEAEEDKEETKKDEKAPEPEVAASADPIDDEEEEIEEEKNITPKENVQNMINYINSLTKDTRVKKAKPKNEPMSLAQAVERGLLPSNLDKDRILEIAKAMGIKADDMDRVVSPSVLAALMDDKEVKLARANLEIANKRQAQVNKNAKVLESIGKINEEEIGSEKLENSVENIAEGLTEVTLEMDSKNQKLDASSVREHFDLNDHYYRGDRAEFLDERGTKVNDKIRKQYAKLIAKTEEAEKAKGKIRQTFANYRVQRVANKIQRLKKKEGRITSKQIELMNKETDKYIAKKQKDLERYMNRQEKLQERVDRYKDLSAQRSAAEDERKQNNENLEKNITDKDFLAFVERGVTRVNNALLSAKMGSLKRKMGATELRQLASQTFDLRLASARGKLHDRVDSINNSEKYKMGGMTTDLGLLAAMDLAKEMSMAA